MAVYQRVDQAGQKLPIDERILADTDTLMVFGLDHLVTEQEAAPEEIEAIRAFLAREGTCLILGPHHDVGASDDLEERNMEYCSPRRPAGASPAAIQQIHPLAYERARRAGPKPLGIAAGDASRHDEDRFRCRSTPTSIAAAGSTV